MAFETVGGMDAAPGIQAYRDVFTASLEKSSPYSLTPILPYWY